MNHIHSMKHSNVIEIENKKNVENKRLKTPLRYPGGKSKAIYKLDNFLPKNIKDIQEIQDPFLGGGSFMVYLTKLYPNKKIIVNDIYEPLYNFWIHLQKYPDQLSLTILNLKTKNNIPILANVLYDEQKKIIKDKYQNPLLRAAAFWIVNKCSFGGLMSSSFSSQASVSNFTINGILSLKYYGKLIKNWEITNLDYKDFIKKYKNNNAFIYLDPPYMIKDNLYGEKGELHKVFSHEDFFKLCPTLSCKHMISYNSNLLIKNAFTNYNISDYDLTYTMRSTGNYMEDQKDRKELVIRNY